MKRLGQFYCLTEEEYTKLNNGTNEIEKKYNEFLNLIARILPTEKETNDKEISREDFIKLHEYMVEQMDLVNNSTETAVYGHSFSVHWHGFCCDCSDGVVAANNIIPAIKEIEEEEK